MKLDWPRCSFLSVILTLALLGSNFLIASAATPKEDLTKAFVRHVSGNCFTLLPFSNIWEPIRSGDILTPNSLIQVTRNSKLVLIIKGGKSLRKLGLTDGRLALTEPTIFRFETNALRNIAVKNYYAASAGDAMDQKSLRGIELYSSMLDAFFQNTVIFTAMRMKAKQIATAFKKSETMNFEETNQIMSGTKKKIDLDVPIDRQMVNSDKIAKFDIKWQSDSQPNEEYDVFFWKKGTSRTPYQRTRSKNLKLSAFTSGSYFVQIVSKDESAISEIKEVVVTYSDFISEAKEIEMEDTDGHAVRKELSLQLVKPPKNFVYIAKKERPSILFTWQRPAAQEGGCQYELTVRQLVDRKLMVTKRTFREVYHWRPRRFGDYEWSVVPLFCKTTETETAKISNLTRASRRFTWSPSRRDALKDFVNWESSRTIYLDF